MRFVATATAESNVSGSRRLRKWGAESGVMYGLSTMNTRSNLAASAFCAFSMNQSMSTLASPGNPGCRQPFCVVPTPLKIAPSFNCLSAIVSPCAAVQGRKARPSTRGARPGNTELLSELGVLRLVCDQDAIEHAREVAVVADRNVHRGAVVPECNRAGTPGEANLVFGLLILG